MDNTFTNILGESLPVELTEKLQEAFDKKVAEAKESAEIAIREEFASRYEHDKATLVEAMDNMISKSVSEFEQTKADEIKKLHESKVRFEQAIKDKKAEFKDKFAKHTSLTESFVMKSLSKEVKTLRENAIKLKTEKKKLNLAFEAVKDEISRDHASRIKKMDEFVRKQLTKEITELNEDHKALVDTRVKLLSENKKKLADIQERFIKESAKKAEKVLTETLKREMGQLHEDLERNRQNSFGRRIFETFAAEFMTSYLTEGSEIRARDNVIESLNDKIEGMKQKLTEVEVATRKAKLAESNAIRSKIMTELLSNLRGDKKAVMESMLETTKTEKLRETFKALLPTVLNEGKPASAQKTYLTSSKPVVSTSRIVTGDRRIMENNKSNSEIDENIAEMKRLAGMK